MNKYDIYRKTRLMKAGLSGADVARMLGVSRQTVSEVMRGKLRSGRVARALCLFTRTPRERFFAEHYPPQPPRTWNSKAGPGEA
jgi:transcriptional regulator with XRE-family HTH domain